MSVTTPEKVKNLLSSFLTPTDHPSKQKTVKLGAASDNTVVKATPSTSSSDITSKLRSYDSFLERLDSFSLLSWFGKPKELSPLICARFGWANVDRDSLQCAGCKAHLCGKLPDEADNKAYQVFTEKLERDILAAHDKFCVLAANPCPEYFCTIPCNDPTSLMSEFSERVASLTSVPAHNLPSIDYSTLHAYKYDEGQGAAYCKRHFLTDLDVVPDIVALSFTGWVCVPSKTDVLMCTRCRREIGLWNFNKNPDPLRDYNEDNSVTEACQGDKEPEAKIPKLKAKPGFNPVEEHRQWCPWLLPTPSSVTPSTIPRTTNVGDRKRVRQTDLTLPAFIMALKVMTPGLMDNNTGLAQSLKTSPVADGLRCVRRVMKSWSSKKSPSIPTTASS